jgi:hypothetical protein
MKMSLKILVNAIPVVAMLVASGSPGLAQDASGDRGGWWPGRGMGQMMMDGPRFGGGMMMGQGPMWGYGQDGFLDRVEGRLAFIKTELAVRDDQTAEWEKFAEAVRTNAENHNGLMRAMMEEMVDGDYFERPLPERLTEQESYMVARLEQIKEMRVAVEALYGVLDDKQKQAADEIMIPAMGMMMR